MKKHIAEELPTRKHQSSVVDKKEGGDEKKGGGESSEKRVRQAVYDIRYRARREDVDLKQAFSQYMQNSSMAANERTLVKQKLFGKSLGEEYSIRDSATDTVSKALYKVFAENNEEGVDLASIYEEEIKAAPDTKYKVEVFDKNSGRSYIRYATREKINSLRLNPNISDVKLLDSRDKRTPYEGEKKKGEQTARALGGGNKPNDGNLANNYPPYDKVTRGDVIAGRLGKDQMGGKRKVKEEFIGEVADTEEKNKLDIMKKNKTNKSCVKVFPSDGEATKGTMGTISASYNIQGEMISETAYGKFLRKVKDLQEKAESEQQQKLFGLALSVKRGETPRSKVSQAVLDIVDKMSEKEIRKFAKTPHSEVPKKVEKEKESECSSEKDGRDQYSKITMVKNKLRAMGMKNPIVMTAGHEPEGNLVSEEDDTEDSGSDSARQAGDWRSRSQRPYVGRRRRFQDPRYGSVSPEEWNDPENPYNPRNKKRPFGRR